MRSAYLVLLAVVAWVVFADVARKRKKERQARAAGRTLDALETGFEWHKTLQKINLPPIMYFPRAGVRCSMWLPVIIGICVGFASGLLGIGGGLFCMPALVYLIGCPTHIAVGTDLFGVAMNGLYGAATYSYKGRVELMAAFIMLIGAAIGAQIGTVATKYVKGYGIRIFFGTAVVGCAVSILLKLVTVFYPQLKPIIDPCATVLILGLVTILASFIAVKFVLGVRAELAMKKEHPVAA